MTVFGMHHQLVRMELNTIGHDQSNLRLLEVGQSAQNLLW